MDAWSMEPHRNLSTFGSACFVPDGPICPPGESVTDPGVSGHSVNSQLAS